MDNIVQEVRLIIVCLLYRIGSHGLTWTVLNDHNLKQKGYHPLQVTQPVNQQ